MIKEKNLQPPWYYWISKLIEKDVPEANSLEFVTLVNNVPKIPFKNHTKIKYKKINAPTKPESRNINLPDRSDLITE